MSDIECPYCQHEQEVNHDDGFGYEENELHEVQCHECNKYFVFTTYISYSYTSYKADCLNGANHNLYKVTHYPPIWPDWVRCKDCEYEKRGEYKELETK